ncbi:response regulator [Sphingomonas adhaesiva]|uniref:response regulator n=1 Tax=Sphingomonas adhaesiva TaxID=28212 RepID=UPI002FFBA495
MSPFSDALLLIVEDQPLHAKLFAEIARANGIRAVTTGKGREAMNLLATLQPVLVLIDIYLPDADGREIIALMRTDDRTRQIPVVAISALPDHQTVTTTLRAGADSFLAKPVSLRALSDELRRHVPTARPSA